MSLIGVRCNQHKTEKQKPNQEYKNEKENRSLHNGHEFKSESNVFRVSLCLTHFFSFDLKKIKTKKNLSNLKQIF